MEEKSQPWNKKIKLCGLESLGAGKLVFKESRARNWLFRIQLRQNYFTQWDLNVWKFSQLKVNWDSVYRKFKIETDRFLTLWELNIKTNAKTVEFSYAIERQSRFDDPYVPLFLTFFKVLLNFNRKFCSG